MECIHGQLKRSCNICELEDRIATLEARIKELEDERDIFARTLNKRDKELALMTHKVITCGVAARDLKLSRTGSYGGEWDSPQAEQVRALAKERGELLTKLSRYEALEKAAREYVAVFSGDFDGAKMLAVKGELNYALAAIEKEKTCRCNLRTKLVGDGCEVCNPDYAEDHC